MNRKIIIIIAIILIVLILCFSLSNKKSESNIVNESDITNDLVDNNVEEQSISKVELKKSLGATKCQDVSDDEIKNLMKTYTESTVYVKNEWYPTEIYLVFDFNNDENMECILIYNNKLYLYQLVDDEAQIVFSKEAENGVFNIFEVTNNETEEKEILITDEFADGLCYEASIIDLMRIEEDMIVFEKLSTYSCDQEKEISAREAIEANPNLTETEREDAYINAHTLKYRVYGEEATEKEFNNFIKDLKTKYTLLTKSNEYSELFD